MGSVSDLLIIIATRRLGWEIKGAIHDSIDILNTTVEGLKTSKEPSVNIGTTSKYYRGDKTWVDLATSVRASTLTGIIFTINSAVAAGDNILQAFGKLQAQINNKVSIQVGMGLSQNSFTTVYKTKLDGLQGQLDNKVNVMDGKALSTNDFTNAHRTKLDEIDESKYKYTPPAVSLVMKDENGYYMREDGLGNHILCSSPQGYFAFPLGATIIE